MTCGHQRFARRAYWRGFDFLSGYGRFFGPGEVRLALLSLLGEAPMHGYELMKRLEDRSGGVYRASAGTIYPTLQQLEDEGLVTSETQDGKKIYRLTDAGRQELQRNDEAVRAIWRRARRWQDWRSAFDPDAAEIRGPAERLLKEAFRAVAGGFATHQRLERVREILLRALREVEELSRGS
ncbi:MAG: helix-turn-helix transcriptional regulator [Deltaproteobacteria bacterium]|nr:helix-turn-helix transcriptional regulator [Deltaproteobacteria bacterium]